MQQTGEKSDVCTRVAGKDLHTPRLAGGLRDSGAVGIQQHRAGAVGTQQAAKHVLCSRTYKRKKKNNNTKTRRVSLPC